MVKTQVYFVGAGPGDRRLLTLRAKEVLASVDIVLYDRLVSHEVLETIPKKVKMTNVGKSAHSMDGPSQEEIIQMIISNVEDGKTVARLKGGDALLFSRGSEEARAMRRKGIKFEIVPGVCSAIGATAYAGIPLTHRDFSSSVLVATGQEGEKNNGKKPIDWKSVPSSSVDTIVILMGVERFPHIASELIRGGLDPKTPVGAVEWGTTKRQKTTFFTLDQGKAKAVPLRAPSVIVIGRVVTLAEDLNWLESALVQ
jgi:uroporphyrin-III C-methyltransferase